MEDGPSYDTKPIFKKISFNNISVYFSDNLIDKGESYGSPVYIMLFEGKNNDSYSLGIILEQKTNQPEDYYLTARKILFSVKMNP